MTLRSVSAHTLARMGFGLLGVLVLLSTSANGSTLSYTAPAGSAFLTQGSVIELDVLNPSGLTLTELRHQIRGGATAVDNRDFSLFYRQGAYDELIEVDPGNFLPAHQVESSWSQISFVPDVPQPAANSLLTFTLNMNAGSGGDLFVDPGLHSFYFFSTATNAGGNVNGIRVVSAANTTGTVLTSVAGDVDLIGAVSKAGSAFTMTTTIDRVPGMLEISYVPEPLATSILVIGIALVGVARRRRILRAA